jgi:ribosomal protein S18 acetylase RimI-like enzyme
VGLGRLVPLVPIGRDGAGELGGIWVAPEARGTGVARAVVADLLAHSPFRTLYCLPFADLVGLYADAGFALVPEGAPVHDAVARKLAWCATAYDRRVVAMLRESS